MTARETRRPTDREVTAAAIEPLVAPVMEWAQAAKSEEDEIRQALIASANSDAYAFAKSLDDQHGFYGADYYLVEILSGYSTWSFREKAVKKWVQENDIRIPYELGEVVLARGEHQARIVEIRTDTAELIVQPLVSDGTDYGATGGWVIAVEKASLAPEAPALSQESGR